MRFLPVIAAVMSLVAGTASAQGYGSGVDGQSVFRVSNTLAPITYSSASVVSPKLASETRVIRMSCTTDCHIRVSGSTVTATTSDTILFGGATEYFKVIPGRANFVGVIRSIADGRIYIDEMAP